MRAAGGCSVGVALFLVYFPVLSLALARAVVGIWTVHAALQLDARSGLGTQGALVVHGGHAHTLREERWEHKNTARKADTCAR
jgi:hypothetical protein